MENFNLVGNVNEINNSSDGDLFDQMNLLVSPPCEKDGKVYAFVSISWNDKEAEFKIPSCELVSNRGFSDTQLKMLVDYIKENTSMLKKEAASINVFKNMFGKL